MLSGNALHPFTSRETDWGRSAVGIRGEIKLGAILQVVMLPDLTLGTRRQVLSEGNKL